MAWMLLHVFELNIFKKIELSQGHEDGWNILISFQVHIATTHAHYSQPQMHH